MWKQKGVHFCCWLISDILFLFVWGKPLLLVKILSLIAANIVDTMLPSYLASSGRSWQIWEDNSQTLITILSLVTKPQSIGAETWYTETCYAWTFAEHNCVWHKKLLKTSAEVTQLCVPGGREIFYSMEIHEIFPQVRRTDTHRQETSHERCQLRNKTACKSFGS